jgi:hypothetical protein
MPDHGGSRVTKRLLRQRRCSGGCEKKEKEDRFHQYD